MNIEIQANGVPANKDVRHFVNCRAELALKALRDQIGLVSVVVDNKTGSGEGVRCLVLIRLSTHPDVVIENNDANLYVAIHRAVDDAGWALARILMRQQSSLMQRQFELIEDQRPHLISDSFVVSERAA